MNQDDMQALLDHGSMLLSSEGLYRSERVKAICSIAKPPIPTTEFDNHKPDTALFNFYIQLLELASQVDKLAPTLGMARQGEDDEGYTYLYPLTDISRIAAHLTNLTLHRAVEPFGPDAIKALQTFGGMEKANASTLSALVSAVNWLRQVAVTQFRSSCADGSHVMTLGGLEHFKFKLGDMAGLAGSYIGICTGAAAVYIGAIQDSMMRGISIDGLTVDGKLPPEQLETMSDAQVLNTLLRAYPMFFSTMGLWREWPDEKKEPTGYLMPIPATHQSGVLLQWDNTIVLPALADREVESEDEAQGYPRDFHSEGLAWQVQNLHMRLGKTVDVTIGMIPLM